MKKYDFTIADVINRKQLVAEKAAVEKRNSECIIDKKNPDALLHIGKIVMKCLSDLYALLDPDQSPVTMSAGDFRPHTKGVIHTLDAFLKDIFDSLDASYFSQDPAGQWIAERYALLSLADDGEFHGTDRVLNRSAALEVLKKRNLSKEDLYIFGQMLFAYAAGIQGLEERAASIVANFYGDMVLKNTNTKVVS